MNLVGLGPAGLAVLALLTALSAPAQTGALSSASPSNRRTHSRTTTRAAACTRFGGRSASPGAAPRTEPESGRTTSCLNSTDNVLFVPGAIGRIASQLVDAKHPHSSNSSAPVKNCGSNWRLPPRRPTLSDPAPIRVTIVRAPSGMYGPALADFIPTTTQAQPASASQSSPLSNYFGLRLGVVSPAVLAHLPPEHAGGAVILAVAPAAPRKPPRSRPMTSSSNSIRADPPSE
jgi:hypothetical protein